LNHAMLYSHCAVSPVVIGSKSRKQQRHPEHWSNRLECHLEIECRITIITIECTIA
jgi:hypothetical protein